MDADEKIPIYVQIRDDLREQIADGRFPPGTAIPSEAELSDEYGVSRLTIRSALEGLEREGVLLSVQGKGVFVVGRKIERDLDELSGFTRTMRQRNVEPKNSVLSRITRPAGELFSRIFKIDPEDNLHQIKRVSEADGVPVALETIYVPVRVLPNLPGLNVVDFSMYDLYDFYGIEVTHAKQTLEIMTLEKHEAQLLGIDTDQAVFRFESTTFSDDVTIEHAITYVRNDLCAYTVNFNHRPQFSGQPFFDF